MARLFGVRAEQRALTQVQLQALALRQAIATSVAVRRVQTPDGNAWLLRSARQIRIWMLMRPSQSRQHQCIRQIRI